jgi:hypothetical protein
MTEMPSVVNGAQSSENTRKNSFLNYKSDSETPITILNKPSSGRGGRLRKACSTSKDSGLRFKPNFAQILGQAGLLLPMRAM